MNNLLEWCRDRAGAARSALGKDFATSGGICATLAILSLIALISGADAADPRPNIVWIVGEDMGPEVRCYGDAQAITPFIDQLARDGARFTRCFTHAAVCAPSRHGLITGRYPIATGSATRSIWGAAPAVPQSRSPADP